MGTDRKFPGEKLLEESEVARAAKEGFTGKKGFHTQCDGRYECWIERYVDHGEDGKRCPYTVRSLASGMQEQCALQEGHEGIHKWGSGD